MKLSYKFNIRHKLTIIILLTSLIPLSFLGYLAYDYQKRVIIEEVTANHLELSNSIAQNIYDNLEFTKRLLKSIASVGAIKALHADTAEDFFRALMGNYNIFRVIYLVNDSRQIIASTDSSVSLPDNWLYSQAIRRSYHGSLSEIYYSETNEKYLRFESFVETPQGHGFNGVLISEINLQSIEDLLKNALKDSKSDGIILDEVGKLIASSHFSEVSPEIKVTQIFDTEVSKLKQIDGKDYLVTIVSLKKFDFYQAPSWFIVLKTPAEVAFQAAFKFRTRIIWCFVLTALIALVAAIFLASSFTSPIADLLSITREISSGNFDCSISPHSADEIGDLTLTFDKMRISLKETKSNLEYRLIQLSTLHEVGKAISSVLDFKKLQNIILETIVKVLKAHKGSLMLLDDSDKILTIGVAIGLSDQIAKETKIELGESISGKVLRDKQPYFVRDTTADEEFSKIKSGQIKTGTLMSVPLVAKEKVLGILNISRPDPNSFSDRDFDLFISLANQAAIAIDNARLYRYAVTDSMTKLYNNRYFQQRLDEELLRADRYDNHVSLIIIDVDHFKTFNDTYGHLEGDRVLKTVAKLIESSIREIDIAARYGGEEFVIICPEKHGEGALIPANRIRETVEDYDFRIDDTPVPITVSLGVACYPLQAKTKKELIEFADCALYFSKHNGRNRTTLFNEIMRKNNGPKSVI